MITMKKSIHGVFLRFLLLCSAMTSTFVPCTLFCAAPYTLCIDGGGSKTLLQIIDQHARVVSFAKHGAVTDAVEGGSSNINTVGKDGLRTCLHKLFEGITVDNCDLCTLLSECAVVAGMAGITTHESKKIVEQVFQELGISQEKIILLADAELNLQLLEGDGIMLIAGTGSICLGKKNGKRYRVGGLGRILGDEGSGYYVGLQALKAALADEYDWGPATGLTPALKEFFGASDLRTIIPALHAQEITPARIARLAPLVFNYAHEQDAVACAIIDQAAQHVSGLLITMLNMTQLDGCEVHLWGGMFKGVHADAFIQNIAQLASRHHALTLINRAHQNPALLCAQKIVRSS